MFLFNIGPC